MDTTVSDIVRKVIKIKLIGAPSTLIISKRFVTSLRKKIECLRKDGLRIVIISEKFPENVNKDSTIAIITPDLEVPEGIYHWVTDDPDTANTILSLFGTGLIQERAGAAFRIAGKGGDIPVNFHYDKTSILGGVTEAITPSSQDYVADIQQARDPGSINLNTEEAIIIERAFSAIDNSFSDNGAIAAAAPPRTESDPNYWFFWQRDAGQIAIGLAELLKHTKNPELKNKIQTRLKKYIEFVTRLPNSEGVEFKDLGISRFTIEGKPVLTYGNPQNDGPAHSALAIMQILHDKPSKALISAKDYLNFLSSPVGQGLTFDPWEFSVGHIFYADNLARKALRKGRILAELHGDQGLVEKYSFQEKKFIKSLKKYYDAKMGYITAGYDLAIPWMEVISKLDIAIIGSILSAYDVTDNFINVDDPKVMQTMRKLERLFINKWAINRFWRKKGYLGMGMGRFPEDTNDGVGSTGGNPWAISTLWSSQYYYRLAERYNFLRKKDSGKFARRPLLDKAEGYLTFVLAHLPMDSLTEQIDGRTGKPRGAEKLSWAHMELCNTLILRNKLERTPF